MATATEVRFGAKGCVLIWDDGTQTTHEYETLRARLAALEGVPDPAALMAAVRECVEANAEFEAIAMRHRSTGQHAGMGAANDRLNAALRRLTEVYGE